MRPIEPLSKKPRGSTFRRRWTQPARRWPAAAVTLALVAAVALAPATAHAFCGFYVSGADGNLYNNATQVVLMRDGNRTVLSMANNYQGPPQDFAMVVPVPVVLRERDVKVLPASIFKRVDALAAPRLVEYWEQDPCNVLMDAKEIPVGGTSRDFTAIVDLAPSGSRDLGVTIEAEFVVDEYEIVILSAKDSLGLDTWLRRSGYNIPKGAGRALRPYVHQGMKFFVAKVDVTKVKRDAAGRVTLSPLRFHYDSPVFSLPVRLGLLNSAGAQDLIIHIVSDEARFQAANYENVTIPTNLEVADPVRDQFGRFYAALFDRVLAQRPRAVITEYAWSAGSCDPCPTQPLSLEELVTLGADALPRYERVLGQIAGTYEEFAIPAKFVLTRLHARYSAESLGEDLVFQAATPIVGGIESFAGDVTNERGARPSPGGDNTFQARYVIRHYWQGPIECKEPERGRWGGPPSGVAPPRPNTSASALAFAERGAPLAPYLTERTKAAHEELVRALPAEASAAAPRPFEDARGCHVGGTGSRTLAALTLLGLVALRRRRSDGV